MKSLRAVFFKAAQGCFKTLRAVFKRSGLFMKTLRAVFKRSGLFPVNSGVD
jgi:hypothetical protein